MKQHPLWDRFLLNFARRHCRRVLRRFMTASHNATSVQELVLREKLKLNSDSEYGRRCQFDRIRSYEDFTHQVPLRTYDEFEPMIDRLRKGEPNVLVGSGQKILMFALTSGTHDRPKYVPVTQRFLEECRAGWNAFGVKALMDHEGTFLRSIIQITSRMDEHHTEAGIPCGAISGLLAATQKYLVRKYYVTPLSVAYIDDPHARYYTIMRLALLVSNPAFVVTANPATHLRLAHVGSDRAESLIRDIHDGTLTQEVAVPEFIRTQLRPRLAPNPIRARFLEHLLHQHGALLPKHYWQLGFLCNWTGGTLGLYLKDLPHYFGDLPIRDIGLIASEGRMSLPVSDGTSAGILDVRSHFYEFIPAELENEAQPDCLRSHQVQIGQEYMIVLTTSGGLYRYRIGDRVRVVDFVGEAPVIEFLSKGAHTSSLTGEKLHEHQVVIAVNSVLCQQGLKLSSYVLAPAWSDPPYYRLHVDIRDGQNTGTLRTLGTCVDRELCRVNIEYASKRKSMRLESVRINVLPAGYLQARADQLSTRYRKNNEQFKHQFLLTRPGDDAEFPLQRDPLEMPRQTCNT